MQIVFTFVTMGQKKKILLVDDHLIFREGLKNMLISSSLDIGEILDASNGKEAIQIARSHDLDLVIMDYNMPELNGIQATELIKSEIPNLPVLFLTFMNSDKFILSAVKSGADGFVTKTEGFDEIEKAIEGIFQHGKFYNSRITNLFVEEMRARNLENDAKSNKKQEVELTDQELKIIQLLFEQKSNQEIAELLNISVRTIHNHRINISRKTKAKNVVGIMLYAIKNNLVKKIESE